MSVTPIDAKINEANQQHKEEILKVLDELREQIDNGTVLEFVATSITNVGTMQMHVACQEMNNAIGMLEIGKHLIITNHLEM